MTARAPRLAWKLVEGGAYAAETPDYEAFAAQRYDRKWVAIVITRPGRGRQVFMGGPFTARHSSQMWTERAIASGEIPADAIDVKAEAAKAAKS